MSKIDLAVNHALNELKMARQRMSLLGAPADSKRPQAWCEYGWPDSLEFRDFYNLYRRGGLAHGAVEKIISGCWKTKPWVIEGDDQDGAKKETDWERKLKPLHRVHIWKAFSEADRRRLVGRYSALLIQVRDSQSWDQPVSRASVIEKFIPVWSGSLKPIDFINNPQSPKFGEPQYWQYRESGVDGVSSGRDLKVHPDRIFILGDRDGIGFLEPAYNSFVSLEKVEGGSGESFLKNAARQLAVNFDKDINLRDIAAMYGVDIDQLHEKFNDAARDMNRANDLLLITQGASTTPLVAPVTDPSPTYNINLQTAACALDIPTKILVGMQTGERASTEDQKYFNSRLQSRREELSGEISLLIEHLIRIKAVDQVLEFTVMWDDLNESTSAERLASAKTMSEINNISLATGQMVFDIDEIREAAGYDTQEETEEEDVDK